MHTTDNTTTIKDFIAGKTLGIRVKLVILAVAAVLMTALALVVLGIWQGSLLENLAQVQTEELVTQNMTQVSRGVIQTIETQNQAVQTKVDQGLALLDFLSTDKGGLSLGSEKTRWNAVNQFSKESQVIDLPNLMLGETWIGKNQDFARQTPLVDDVLNLIGVRATIFQKMNDAGDLIRVGTNIQGDNNQRAIGTFIPAVQPDGKPNPVVAAVTAGKTYRGLAFVVNDWYVAAYKPITDPAGKLFAVLFVGVRQKDMESLRGVLTKAQIGERGTAFVVGGGGSIRGQYIASKDIALEGKNILQSDNPQQVKIAEELLNKAVTLQTGEEYLTRHNWQSPGDAAPQPAITRLVYYAPWDWVIGVTAFEEDQQHYVNSLNQRLNQMILLFLGGSLGIAVLLTGVTWWLTGIIIRPILAMSSVADGLAQGDMDQHITFTNADEVGKLANSLRRMLDYLHEMAQAARHIADGDLTTQVTPHSPKDGLGYAFADMIESLHKTVQQVSLNAHQLTVSSAELTQSAQQAQADTQHISNSISSVLSGMNNQTLSAAASQRAVEQVSRSIRGVAHGAQAQAQAVDQAAALTSQLSLSVNRLTQAAQKAAAGGTAVSEASQVGADRVHNTIQAMANIRGRVEISADKVQEMGRRTEEIGLIVETIDDIASQTNLLALNAAIEAARAGEVGKGFAVVADEVRRLAERAAASTRQVHNLVASIQSTTLESTQAMQASVQEVAQGVEKANQAGQALESILKTAGEVYQSATLAISEADQAEENSKKLVDSMQVVSTVVEANTAATSEMASAAAEVRKSMEAINQITQQNTGAVEAASNSTHAMSAQVKQVSAAAEALAHMAQALNQVVNQFRIEQNEN